jgi:hypothetical protein
MDATKQIHENLMDGFNEAIENALDQLDVVDPSGENLQLEITISAGIVGKNPLGLNGLSTKHYSIIIGSSRGNLGEIASILAEVAALKQAEYPNPEGIQELDYFERETDLTDDPNLGFSAN